MSFLEGLIYIMWRGLAIGIIISAPMGPVGILCVQRTLEKGRKTGFYTGVGAAISDLFYCLITGFGLSLVEDFLKANQDIIQVVGSIVIAAFGIYLFKSNPSRNLKKPDAALSTGKRDIMKGFLFTFSNPLIIFLIIGLFARFNFLLPEISVAQYIAGYIFIIIGALGWWWMVSYFVNKVRSHFNLRSMWLINKITGSIIMVFALVGIITAITNIASAARPSAIYLNTVRGMGEWDNSRDSNFLRLPNGDFALQMRLSGLGNGKEKSAALVLKGEGKTVSVNLDKEESGYNELYPSIISASVEHDNIKLDGTPVTLDSGEAPVALSLVSRNGALLLRAGDRGYQPLLQLPELSWQPDTLVFVKKPGSPVTADYISLVSENFDPASLASCGYDFADQDVRDSYLRRVTDSVEGYWEIFDRTLEDEKLRMGGDYRLMIAATGSDYAIYYMSGAAKNPDMWAEGDIKGKLTSDVHKNVYDVTWLDPAGNPIEGEIKAQFTAPDLLTLQFVDQSSTLRLKKLKKQ